MSTRTRAAIHRWSAGARFAALLMALWLPLASLAQNTGTRAEDTAPSSRLRVASAMQLASTAHQTLGGWSKITPATCAEAEPLLQEALVTLNDVPATRNQDNQLGATLLSLGYCRIAQGREGEAEPYLRDAMRRNDAWIPPARACLAQMYATGRGVPLDAERAVGLFALSKGENCSPMQRDNDRDAAELILAQQPAPTSTVNPLVYTLLEAGPPRNWQRALELHRNTYTNAHCGREQMRIALKGHDANGLGEEDEKALKALNLFLGNCFLRARSLAQAYAYLHAADPKEADSALALWRKSLRYRLILADGREWSATDATP